MTTTTNKKSDEPIFAKDWKFPVSLLHAELSYLDNIDESIKSAVIDLNRLGAFIENQALFFKFLHAKLEFLDAMKIHLEKSLPFDRNQK